MSPVAAALVVGLLGIITAGFALTLGWDLARSLIRD